MQPLKDVRVPGVMVFLAGLFLCMHLARFGAEGITGVKQAFLVPIR